MNRNLILLAASLATWGIGEGMFLYFNTLYFEELGANPQKIGLILGAMGIAMTVAHIPAGHMADRIGRRPIIWLSWLTGLTAAWIMAAARSLEVFVGGMLLYSMTAFVMAPMNSYITAARGRWSVGQAIAVVNASFSAGAILGPSLGGLVARQTGGLRSIYFVAACIFIVSSAMIFFLKAQPIAIPTEHQRSVSPLREWAFLRTMGIIFFATFAMFLAQPLTPNFLKSQHGLNYGQIGALGSVASLGVVICNLALGHIKTRRGFILGQAITLLFTIFLLVSHSFIGFAIGYFTLGGYRVFRAMAAAQARDLVHHNQMGLAYGITETVAATALILAPPIAGVLYDWVPASPYAVGIVLIVIAIAISFLFLPRTGLETEPHPAAHASQNPVSED